MWSYCQGWEIVAPYPSHDIDSTGNFFIRTAFMDQNAIKEVMEQKLEQNRCVRIKDNGEIGIVLLPLSARILFLKCYRAAPSQTTQAT